MALLAVSFAPRALAQATEEERARGHFQAASSYFDEGDYESAIREFQRAYDLSHRPGLLYNIALSHERLAHYAEAAQLLRRYLHDQADVPNRDALERRIQHLEERAQGTGPAPPSGPDRPPTGPSSPGAPLPIGSIISFSVAGAGLVVYAIAGGLALSEYSAIQSGCGATASCTDADVSNVRTMAAVADVGLAIAVVGAAVGAVLLVIELGSSSSSTASLRLTPAASPEGAGLFVGGAF